MHAIVAALAVLSSWFTRTEEGQNALNVASAYFKQTLDSILDVVDDVGEWLFNAFTKPKEALQDLSDFLEDQVMVRLKALGKMGEAVVKIFSKNYKQGFADLGNAWLEHRVLYLYPNRRRRRNADRVCAFLPRCS